MWGAVLVTLSVGAVNLEENHFFTKPNKIFYVYVVNRELIQNEGVYHQEPTNINLALELYRQFERRLQKKGCSVKPILVETSNITFNEADIILVIRSTFISSLRGYYPLQKNGNFKDVELDLELFIPKVFGTKPVADYYIRQTLPRTLMTEKSVTKEFAGRLSRLYIWQSNERLLNYLNGDIDERSFILGRLILHPDDEVARKLLELSAPSLPHNRH